eukprot:SAG31_NODE_21803_length_540_cov_1.342404_1_plen_78_part_01
MSQLFGGCGGANDSVGSEEPQNDGGVAYCTPHTAPRTQLVRILVLVLQVSVLSVLQVLAAAGYTAVLILRDGILILNL